MFWEGGLALEDSEMRNHRLFYKIPGRKSHTNGVGRILSVSKEGAFSSPGKSWCRLVYAERWGEKWVYSRHVCACHGTGDRTACGSKAFPSTMWVTGIKLRHLGFPYVMFDVWAAPADNTALGLEFEDSILVPVLANYAFWLTEVLASQPLFLPFWSKAAPVTMESTMPSPRQILFSRLFYQVFPHSN